MFWNGCTDKTEMQTEWHCELVNIVFILHNCTIICIMSGGKDSTVLAHLMTLLNDRYSYGLKLVLLSIDEGITGE